MSGFTPGERQEFIARVRAAQRSSARIGRPILAWISRPAEDLDPLAFFAAAAGGERFFWEEPGAGARLVAAGAAMTLEGVGRGRLREVAEQAETLFGDAALPADSRLAGPLLVGGFAFSPDAAGPTWQAFPPARFVVPEQLLVRSGGQTFHTTSVLVRPDAEAGMLVHAAEAGWSALRERAEQFGTRPAELTAGGQFPDPEDEFPASFRASANPSPARYRAIVRRALDAIRAGKFEKVVVARACTLSRPGGFEPARVLETLCAAHPDCFRFAVGHRDSTFLAATPERLLRLDGRQVRASALAGSAPRGRNPEEDARLGAQLRESKKEQEEHAVVVRALRSALEQCCERVDVPEAPELLCLEGIQHLHTPIEGVLHEHAPRSLLDLAARLHPSPAVAGSPREAALAWLRAHEGVDRGWYGGAVGWMTPGGQGELAVALRTALLRGDDAILHAGAGIVAGSTPDAELMETRLKLRAGLAALLEI